MLLLEIKLFSNSTKRIIQLLKPVSLHLVLLWPSMELRQESILVLYQLEEIQPFSLLSPLPFPKLLLFGSHVNKENTGK